MKIIILILFSVLILFGCITEVQQDKVGAIIFLTGSQSALGEEVNNALILASEGKGLQIIVEDSEDNPQKAISAFEKLKSQGINKFIITGDQVNYAITPLIKDEFVIATVAASSGIKNEKNYRAWLTTKTQADLMSNFAVNELKLDKFSLIYINNVYGEEYKQTFSKKANVISSQSYGIADSEFKTQVTKAINSNPDAIVVAGFGTAYSLVFKTLREQGYTGIILTDATLSIPFFFDGIGIENLNNTYYVSTLFDAQNPSSSEMSNFVNSYKEKFGKEAGWTGAFAYDAYSILLEANSICTENLDECIGNISHTGVLGEVRFKDGEMKVPLQIKQVVGNEIKVVKEID